MNNEYLQRLNVLMNINAQEREIANRVENYRQNLAMLQESGFFDGDNTNSYYKFKCGGKPVVKAKLGLPWRKKDDLPTVEEMQQKRSDVTPGSGLPFLDKQGSATILPENEKIEYPAAQAAPAAKPKYFYDPNASFFASPYHTGRRDSKIIQERYNAFDKYYGNLGYTADDEGYMRAREDFATFGYDPNITNNIEMSRKSQRFAPSHIVYSQNPAYFSKQTVQPETTQEQVTETQEQTSVETPDSKEETSLSPTVIKSSGSSTQPAKPISKPVTESPVPFSASAQSQEQPAQKTEEQKQASQQISDSDYRQNWYSDVRGKANDNSVLAYQNWAKSNPGKSYEDFKNRTVEYQPNISDTAFVTTQDGKTIELPSYQIEYARAHGFTPEEVVKQTQEGTMLYDPKDYWSVINYFKTKPKNPYVYYVPTIGKSGYFTIDRMGNLKRVSTRRPADANKYYQYGGEPTNDLLYRPWKDSSTYERTVLKDQSKNFSKGADLNDGSQLLYNPKYIF